MTSFVNTVFIICLLMFGSLTVGYYIGREEQKKEDEIVIKKLRDYIRNLHR